MLAVVVVVVAVADRGVATRGHGTAAAPPPAEPDRARATGRIWPRAHRPPVRRRRAGRRCSDLPGQRCRVDLGSLLAGGAALVNVWASWCQPCQQELPALDAYAAPHGAIRVIGVQVQSGQADGLHLLAQHRRAPPADGVRHDGAAASALHLPVGLPVSYLVRPDGTATVITSPSRVLDTVDQVKQAVATYLGGGLTDSPGPLVEPDTVPDWLAPLVAGTPTWTPSIFPHRCPAAGGHTAGRRADAVRHRGPDGPDVLLLRRADTLGSHPGQVAFPGGGAEPADDGPVATALREAVEEVGVDPAGVRPVALLPKLFVPVSGFEVTPVLAHWVEPSAVRAVDPAETAAVARVPVAHLVDPANRLLVRGPAGFVSPAFLAPGMLIWGFTAGVLTVLLGIAGWDGPWDGVPEYELEAAWRVAMDLAQPAYRYPPGCGRGGAAVNWVDLLVLIIAVMAAASGARQGVVIALPAFLGVLLGAVVGVRRGPAADPELHRPGHQGGVRGGDPGAAGRARRDVRRVVRPVAQAAHPQPEAGRVWTTRSARSCRASWCSWWRG